MVACVLASPAKSAAKSSVPGEKIRKIAIYV